MEDQVFHGEQSQLSSTKIFEQNSKYFEPEDLNDLPDDLLRRIEKRKLADKLATLQAEQFRIPQRPSGRATNSLRQA
jgi:predicted transcriptional regulator